MSLNMKTNPGFDPNNVQWVQVSDTHPQSAGVTWVGRDDKLHLPIIIKHKKYKCKRHKDYIPPWQRNTKGSQTDCCQGELESE